MMHDAMVSIFGEYHLVDGSTNWEYIGAVVLIAICLHGFFRFVGGVFKR